MAASRGHFLLAAWLLEQGASACATDALLRTPENVAATPALQITLELASRAELENDRKPIALLLAAAAQISAQNSR